MSIGGMSNWYGDFMTGCWEAMVVPRYDAVNFPNAIMDERCGTAGSEPPRDIPVRGLGSSEFRRLMMLASLDPGQ